jgi:hypothetical protein
MQLSNNIAPFSFFHGWNITLPPANISVISPHLFQGFFRWMTAKRIMGPLSFYHDHFWFPCGAWEPD